PPRLSTACINALAACDFVLVPALLDAVSARSVPNLLRTVRRLRSPSLFPNLRCLGAVANKVTTLKGNLIAAQAQTWKELPVACRVAWESDVYLFETMVPDKAHFGKASGPLFGAGNGPGLALKDKEIHRIFTALLQEIETRVEHERKLLAAVPPKPA